MLSANLVEAYPVSNEEMRAALVSVLDDLTRTYRPMLTALFAAGTCVLILCLLNITNILLADLSTRSVEFQVRRALGGDARRLLAQFAGENSLVVSLGCLVGLLLAGLSLNLLVRNGASLLPPSRLHEIGLDSHVMIYCVAISIATALLWIVLSTARVGAWKAWIGGRLVAFQKPGKARTALVVVQIGVSFGLLCGAGLLLNSYLRLSNIDLGFADDEVLYSHLSVPESLGHRPERMAALSRGLRDRLARFPRWNRLHRPIGHRCSGPFNP